MASGHEFEKEHGEGVHKCHCFRNSGTWKNGANKQGQLKPRALANIIENIGQFKHRGLKKVT